MPKLDEGYLLIETRRAPSASLPRAWQSRRTWSARSSPSRKSPSVVTNLGRPHEATETMALNQADVYVTFKPKRRMARAFARRADRADGLGARGDSGPRLRVQRADARCDWTRSISGVRTDLGVKIYGDSLPLLQEKADEIERVVARVPGAEDVSVGASAGAMQLEIDLDRPAIARYGLNVADVREAVESGIGGSEATQVLDGRRRYPIVVRLERTYRSTPEAVGQTLIRTPAGGTVALSQVARLRTVEGPEVVEHEGGQRYVVVQSNVRGRDLGSFAADVRRSGRRARVTAAGLFRGVRRAVREPGARDAAPRGHRAARAVAHRRAAVRELRDACGTRCSSCSTCRSRWWAGSRRSGCAGSTST